MCEQQPHLQVSFGQLPPQSREFVGRFQGMPLALVRCGLPEGSDRLLSRFEALFRQLLVRDARVPLLVNLRSADPDEGEKTSVAALTRHSQIPRTAPTSLAA